MCNGSTKEIRPLVYAGGDQKSAVARALDDQFTRAGVPVVYQILRSALKVVEYVLLVQQTSAEVPLFSVLAVNLPKISFNLFENLDQLCL